MNNSDAIKLGAACQREFEMAADFSIVEIRPSDNTLVQVVTPTAVDFEGPIGNAEVSLIELKEFWINMGPAKKLARCGYSEKANSLVIEGRL